MKKTLLVFLFSILTFSIFAQLSNECNAYYPNGKKINLTFNTIKDLLDTLGIKETENYNNKYGIVYFKRLSNKPIFILFFKQNYPTKIKEIIASYNQPYYKYLNSYDYYFDLKDMIKKGSLTKDYLKDIFNEPDIKEQNEDGSEFWVFKNYNVKIIFNNDIAQSADVINYKAIKRNGLSISTFDVTGSDYTIGFDISLSNFGNKTIKYVFITVTSTNPVHDKVGTKTVKAVGPIKPDETGSYEFEDIIYSTTAKYLSIDNVKIQYMDGTIKLISKSDVQNIRIQDWEEVGNRTIDD